MKRNSYPTHVVDKVFKKHFEKKISKRNSKIIKEKDTSKVRYIKLSYIGTFSEQLRSKLKKLCKQFYKGRNIKVAFSFFEIGSFYSPKDRTPKYLKSLLVYKFSCIRFHSCYIGEICLHFQTRTDEHIRTDENWSI